MTTNTVTLYRPVGRGELDLIAATGYKAFPPRLPDQPIFYPVLNREYAEQIARDWNTQDERSGYVGYVVEFEVDSDYLATFSVKKVGAANHLEYWIPAEELQNFNLHIRGGISCNCQLHQKQIKIGSSGFPGSRNLGFANC